MAGGAMSMAGKNSYVCRYVGMPRLEPGRQNLAIVDRGVLHRIFLPGTVNGSDIDMTPGALTQR